MNGIPANLLTDIDNAEPPELWNLLTILAEWLEECGDLRADGIRWLVEHRRKPQFVGGRYKWFASIFNFTLDSHWIPAWTLRSGAVCTCGLLPNQPPTLSPHRHSPTPSTGPSRNQCNRCRFPTPPIHNRGFVFDSTHAHN